ncbi:MAG: hypothetical protein AABW79_04905 [Nanoarchaeota archaeon]|mgnify:CR=1 FL=1
MSHNHHHHHEHNCNNWGNLESRIGRNWKDFVPVLGAINYPLRVLSALKDETESHQHTHSRASMYFEAVVIAHTCYLGTAIISASILLNYIFNR